MPPLTAAGIVALVSPVLVTCLEIRSLWCIDLSPNEVTWTDGTRQLLAFADFATLYRLRKLQDLHRADVDLLVVTDGDAFEAAWGAQGTSGSLARSAWRETSAGEAFYDRTCWTDGIGAARQVMRMRRKALLAWARLP